MGDSRKTWPGVSYFSGKCEETRMFDPHGTAHRGRVRQNDCERRSPRQAAADAGAMLTGWDLGQGNHSAIEPFLNDMMKEETLNDELLQHLQERSVKRKRIGSELREELKHLFEERRRSQAVEQELERRVATLAGVAAKEAKAEALKVELEAFSSDLSIKEAELQRRERSVKAAEESLISREKDLVKKLHDLEMREKEIAEREMQTRRLRRRKTTGVGYTAQHRLEGHSREQDLLTLPAPACKLEEEQRCNSPPFQENNQKLVVALLEVEHFLQETPSPCSSLLLNGSVGGNQLTQDSSSELLGKEETFGNNVTPADNVWILALPAVVRQPPSSASSGKAARKERVKESMDENFVIGQSELHASCIAAGISGKPHSNLGNHEEDDIVGKAGGKGGNGRNSRATLEEALKQDMPELFASMQEKGLLEDMTSFDRVLLEDDKDEDIDGLASHGGFTALQKVLRKLFEKSQEGGRCPSSGWQQVNQMSTLLNGRQKYCMENLVALLDQMKAVRRAGWPVMWSWSRRTRAFVFVFNRHNRIVLEWPEYGNATYFFELEADMAVEWQVKRILAVMAASYVGKASIIENKCLEVGVDISVQEGTLLQCYGWSPSSGLGSLLNYCDRLFHDYKKVDKGESFQRAISVWRERIGKRLVEGIGRGGRTRELPEAYLLWNRHRSEDESHI